MFPAMAIATRREYALFIGGEGTEAAAGTTHELTEPATGEPLATVAVAGEEDVDRAVAAARAAFDGAVGQDTADQRSRLLHALADAMVANRKELAELEVRNVGKAICSVKAELARRDRDLPLLRLGDRAARRPLRTRSAASLISYTLREPVGVCGQIVPWNYPLMMATWKLAPALAAGCTIVLKPAPRRR